MECRNPLKKRAVQSSEKGTTDAAAEVETSTDPQNPSEETNGMGDAGSNNSTRPNHGIELPDDNW